ncbi:MCE family protein [Mycolicibacillus trivialis]|uniref:MCE-family protein MCE1A n=1 Tax=Mycolicibacillus trivialis TaxID=1798 RepID=A0A1X2EF94_9MYCO|nr:MCE family protein [Mycolicibacillus trivialis]ORX00063.1 MCE-family protein MCE1A [Mycolicibacillus trivialis]
MTTHAPLNKPRVPPYKWSAVIFLAILALIVGLVYLQFRGSFTPKTQLTMLAARAGLVMDPGAPVTYNGVQIGKVADISETQQADGQPGAKFLLEVHPKYVKLIPENVRADIMATTVFGNKYVSLTAPKDEKPSARPITSDHVIDAVSVTTEINTVFETIMDISEQIDPVKLNLTLSAAAEALAGLGDKFGASLVNANDILDDLNPRMPQFRHDMQALAATADVYADASPDLWDALDNALTTVGTLREYESDVDEALLSAVGFGNTGEDIVNRGGPYLVRGLEDLVVTAKLLDTYSPEFFCTLRNFHDVAPKVNATFGGHNGYSLRTSTTIIGAPNPYIYPDNLPRLNARGGPGGAPGCWQPITKDLWPAPTLVVDSGASIAPYNHFELGQPMFTEYVWGRQYGENTINP